MAIRSVESEVKALPDSDTDQVFSSLRERVLRQGSFKTQPAGFHGMGIVAKHHSRFQSEVLSILSGIEAKELGIWVVKGWNEILTEPAAQEQLRTLMSQWTTQDANDHLKKAAKLALSSLSKGTG